MVNLIPKTISPMAQSSDHQRGFTLLEIMVVMVLLGITSSLVLNRLFADRDPLARSAMALKVTLQKTLDHATQQQTLYGVAIAKNGWQLMAYRDETASEQYHWQEIPGNTFTLPEEITTTLEIEQQAISLPEQLTSPVVPQIWIYPGGETSIFSLSLLQDNCTQRINASGFISFQLQEMECSDE